MSEDKQCLQRDNTEGRCLEEGCGKNKLDVCMFLCRMVSTHDEHTAMAKAGNECQPAVYMSLHGNIAIVVCCAEVLFQTRNLSHPTRCLWYGRTGTKHADHDGT